MPTGNKVHNWMVRNLEEPFYKAEMHRAKLSKGNKNSGRPKLILISLLTLAVPVMLLVVGK